MRRTDVVKAGTIENRIFNVRGQKVMLDVHLAELYGVKTKALIQAVKRNIQRFPAEFMFQLSSEEYERLRSHFVTSKRGRGGRRYLPYVFTEHGVAMLSAVLKTDRAVKASILVIRVFVRLREIVSAHKELSVKLQELEQKVGKHDVEIQSIIEALRELIKPPDKPVRRIGFGVEEPKVRYSVKRHRS